MGKRDHHGAVMVTYVPAAQVIAEHCVGAHLIVYGRRPRYPEAQPEGIRTNVQRSMWKVRASTRTHAVALAVASGAL